jgi:hypothetical protein
MLVINHHTNNTWVRVLESKYDTCPQLESILLEIRHTHAMDHSSSGAFAPVLKFDSYPVFEATATRVMCGRLGVGVQYSARYAHHMFGKADHPWRTLRDNASDLMHNISVPNSMWSCAISTVVYLRNRMFNRAAGISGGAPLTLLTSHAPDASKFRVSGCSVFAKVPDKLRYKHGEKAFRGIMVGYPFDAPGYCIYNSAIRRITTSVHVVFQEDVPGFSPSLTVDSLI